MESPFGKAFVIVNQRAGKGLLRAGTDGLDHLLREASIDYVLHVTQARGHALQLAGDAIDEGYRFVVAAGGDGTIHEVVNGMMSAGRGARDAVLGVLPAGSGSDFIRTFGLPQKVEDAVAHLKGDQTFRIDLGKATYSTPAGERSVYFSNIAEAGLGGAVVRRAERLPRSLGRSRYLLGFWMTLFFTKATEGTVKLDGKTYEGRITNLVVANGQFFGGGMRVAPRAHPGDGKFDVLIQVGTKGDYIAAITKVFKGEHIPSPVIKEYHAARVEVATRDPLQMEADGEILGTTPATFEIVESALDVKI